MIEHWGCKWGRIRQRKSAGLSTTRSSSQIESLISPRRKPAAENQSNLGLLVKCVLVCPNILEPRGGNRKEAQHHSAGSTLDSVIETNRWPFSVIKSQMSEGVVMESLALRGRCDKEGRPRNINLLCSRCVRSCKQSSKVIVCACPKFSPADTQKEAGRS